jgi:hypothetical protein
MAGQAWLQCLCVLVVEKGKESVVKSFFVSLRLCVRIISCLSGFVALCEIKI